MCIGFLELKTKWMDTGEGSQVIISQTKWSQRDNVWFQPRILAVYQTSLCFCVYELVSKIFIVVSTKGDVQE